MSNLMNFAGAKFLSPGDYTKSLTVKQLSAAAMKAMAHLRKHRDYKAAIKDHVLTVDEITRCRGICEDYIALNTGAWVTVTMSLSDSGDVASFEFTHGEFEVCQAVNFKKAQRKSGAK